MRIKLINPDKGRNRQAFYPFLQYSKMFEMFDIEFITYGQSDYTFIGVDDFVNRKISLDDSVNQGIEFVNKYKFEKVFLFDSTDSTSLLGVYEVLDNTNVQSLFKNQLLNFSDYSRPSYFNKWFFRLGDQGILKGYNISSKNISRIQLSGWNLGFYNTAYHTFIDRNLNDISMICDVCAIYQYEHDENYDHNYRNDISYTDHRYTPYEILHTRPDIKTAMGRLEQSQYYDILMKSKFALSPFGMGEICYRDFELMCLGIPMIKPEMNNVLTEPNIYIPWQTYIPVKPDWSNLIDVVDQLLSEDYTKFITISENFKKKFRSNYLVSELIRKWHQLLLLK